MINKMIFLDCEGPITLNDNALELCGHFMARGEHFFSLLSRYDDYLAEVIKRPGYRAGNTLKFIVPFLKAFGVTNEKLRQFCETHIRFVPEATRVVRRLSCLTTVSILSTSYCFYLEAVNKKIGSSLRIYGTDLDLDRYSLSEAEARILRGLKEEISEFPLFSLKGVVNIAQLTPSAREVIDRLEDVFQRKMAKMNCRHIMEKIQPVGGSEKVKPLLDLCGTSSSMSEIMYVGDSITDLEVLRLVRQRGGVAVSFNGNRYAVREAEFACTSFTALPILFLGEIFHRRGKEGVLKISQDWPRNLPDDWRKKLLSPATNAYLTMVTEKNRCSLIERSEMVRRRVRGEEIAMLG